MRLLALSAITLVAVSPAMARKPAPLSASPAVKISARVVGANLVNVSGQGLALEEVQATVLRNAALKVSERRATTFAINFDKCYMLNSRTGLSGYSCVMEAAILPDGATINLDNRTARVMTVAEVNGQYGVVLASVR